MPRPLHVLAARVALALVVALSAGVLSGCNQPPALTKLELDEGKLSEKHPKVDPEIAHGLQEMPPRAAGDQAVATARRGLKGGAGTSDTSVQGSRERFLRRKAIPPPLDAPPRRTAALQTSSPGVRRSPGLVLCPTGGVAATTSAR